MTRQQFARLKLKAYNNGKRAALRDEKPKLPDCENVSLAELEELLNAMSEGQLAGVKKQHKIITESENPFDSVEWE